MEGERPWVPPPRERSGFFWLGPALPFCSGGGEEEEEMLRRRREIKKADESFIKCAASRELFEH